MQYSTRCAILAVLFLVIRPVVANETVDIVLVTSEGTIEIALYADKAPVTVNNFLRYVDDGQLKGGSFYRVVTDANDNGNPKINVVQGGMRRGGKAFPAIAHETTKDTGILHTDGVISMARGKVGTARSEFFICIGDQPGLDFGQPRNADRQGFAAFGKVTRGMDVIRIINGLPADADTASAYTKGQMLNTPVVIVSASRK